jgi:hypothetical protein
VRVPQAQVFPAWAALALLVRLDAPLREIGATPWLGWIALASALFAALSGIFNTDWRRSLSAWASTSFSLSLAALAFAGPAAALTLAMGTGLAVSLIAVYGDELGGGAEPIESDGAQGVLWSRLAIGLAAAAGTGMIGFVTSGAQVRLTSLALSEPALIVAVELVSFLFAFLGWVVAWTAIRSGSAPRSSWLRALMPSLLLIASMGLLWTGAVSGGIVIGHPDRVMPSLLGLIFGPNSDAWGDEGVYLTASALHWGGLVVAIAAAFWAVRGKKDFRESMSGSAPRVTAFVAEGYGVDALFLRLLAGLTRVGVGSQWLVDQKAWGLWLPSALARGLEKGAGAIAKADAIVAHRLGGALRRWVDAPSRVLQVIQNGDVQWYLFFAVGSGIAILAHFMLRTQ